MTAEPIAKVVSDLRKRRPTSPSSVWTTHGGTNTLRTAGAQVTESALRLVEDPVVVDASAIYESIVTSGRAVHPYEDHPCIAPPWRESAVCFVNEFGTVFAMHLVADERPVGGELVIDPWRVGIPLPRPCADHTVEDDVRWRMMAFTWIGGAERDLRLPTIGPVYSWQIDVYADGSPADIRTVDLNPDYPWDTALVVLLGTLNFLACKNVELVEPARPRPERRRIAATGVTVKTLNVYPVGAARRSGGRGLSTGVPLKSVRGTFHHYGPRYNRGLLFGKYEGKFWVPQHARGDAQFGRVEHDMVRLVTP